MWLAQRDDLSLLRDLVAGMLRNRYLSNVQDRNREKGIQPIKQEFTTKKGNFLGKIVRNLCSNEVIDFLVEEMNSSTNEDSSISKSCVKSQEILVERIRLSFLIPFALDESEEYDFS